MTHSLPLQEQFKVPSKQQTSSTIELTNHMLSRNMLWLQTASRQKAKAQLSILLRLP